MVSEASLTPTFTDSNSKMTEDEKSISMMAKVSYRHASHSDANYLQQPALLFTNFLSSLCDAPSS